MSFRQIAIFAELIICFVRMIFLFIDGNFNLSFAGNSIRSPMTVPNICLILGCKTQCLYCSEKQSTVSSFFLYFKMQRITNELMKKRLTLLSGVIIFSISSTTELMTRSITGFVHLGHVLTLANNSILNNTDIHESISV